ncbi:ABC transporter permease [Streptomyces sp. NBC_00102]|uniref:ABC transporter permease n=1 Tax=Streptomyces sp. NBC_00102 TaxID=2975652 RepID=UPI002252779F|nr:ABC transporter permease [Streptomyces sp. NBC_00102]MCX5396467.1 ABC transporter permease [Streptomyces sp. NBC_00102]
MTAPLTPPDPPTPYDPWPSPPAGSYLAPGQSPPARGEARAEVVRALAVTAAVAVAGVALGLLWLWLSPRIPLISDDTAVYLKDSEGEEAIGADGTFTLLGAGFGVVSAGVVYLLRRTGGIPTVVALALGGLLGGLLAWWLGTSLGPTSDVVAHAKQAGQGVTFDAPLELNAKGALLAWPVAAMIVHLILTAAFTPRDPDPDAQWEHPAWAAQGAEKPYGTDGRPGHDAPAAPAAGPEGAPGTRARAQSDPDGPAGPQPPA